MQSRLILALFAASHGLFSQTHGERLFEEKIRPLLASRCVVCHSSQQRMGGLDLTVEASFREHQVRLLPAIGYEGKIKMPPTGKLGAAEIGLLTEWMKAGAPWPKTAPIKDGPLWSFQPLRRSFSQPSIDAFLKTGMAQAAPADKATLLRRATYDLTGLPPTPEEIRAFLSDTNDAAFARVVDRLLASPRYGEKWGRHWLDVARYADSTGADEDHRYPHAWRYRDYVIDAFNADLPYDQFVREQIAGDMLPAGRAGEVNTRGIIATGFLALGPKLIAEQDKVKMFYDIVDEQIDVTGRAFLGLTIACARCHDHKFDPITTKDYYSLASIFASTKQLSKLEGTVSQLYFEPLVPAGEAKIYQDHQKKLEAKQKEIDAVVAGETTRFRAEQAPGIARYMIAARAVYTGATAKAEGLDPAVLQRWVEYLKPNKERRIHLEPWYAASEADLQATADTYQKRYFATLAVIEEGRKATPKRQFFAGDDRFYSEITSGKGPLTLPTDRDRYFSAEIKQKLEGLQAELKQLKAAGPPEPPLACAVAEGENVEQRVFVRGNPESKGDLVTKRFPAALTESQPPLTGSGRRQLADWIAGHPLTARVMANRIWQWHFGEGLVRTPSNYGRVGEKPTHPELLDWLAARFIANGFSVKAMHRMIMLSKAYQMGSLGSKEALERDADNRLLTRFPQRRLAVEEIRDSLLALGSALDLTMGGGMLKGEGTDKEFSDDRMSLNPDTSLRRTIYLPLRRSNLPSLLNLFDFGDATTSGEGRSQTNVAPQALYMMNSEFVERQAKALSRKLEGLPIDQRVEELYLRVTGRHPLPAETQLVRGYVQGFRGPEPWVSYTRALISSNDFLYVH